eukprot:108942-Chlamydomonas_euryale.AAC.1
MLWWSSHAPYNHACMHAIPYNIVADCRGNACALVDAVASCGVPVRDPDGFRAISTLSAFACAASSLPCL